MPARRRLGWVLPAAVVAVCAVLAAGRGVMSKEPSGAPAAKTVFPPNRSVLPSGGFDLIAKADKGSLEVNGKPRKWESFRPPLRVAHIHLSAGFNELKIDNQKLELFVARYPDDEDAPSGWKTYKSHPVDEKEGVKRCGDCHKNSNLDGQVAVGEFKGYKACFECHKSVEFEAVHSHPLEPLEPCQMCHEVHGSTHKALLKAPVKKLCADCHDS